MPHHHSHSHNISPHSCSEKRLGRTLLIGIWLNTIYVVIESIFGFTTSSMGLLSDAGHNLSDVASLVISLLALKAAHRKPTQNFTYGFKKATVNASVANAIILYVAVIFILVESIGKLIHPADIRGDVVAWVAGTGVIINGLTAWLLMRDSHRDLNAKGAYLHMISDTAVSVGVVISGIIIAHTGLNIIDPIIGIAIALTIAISSYSLLRDSLRLIFDGVPRDVHVDKIKECINSVPGVESLHHLHIWALSTTEAAMTVHVVVADAGEVDSVIREVRSRVAPLGITHSTIEAETDSTDDTDID